MMHAILAIGPVGPPIWANSRYKSLSRYLVTQLDMIGICITCGTLDYFPSPHMLGFFFATKKAHNIYVGVTKASNTYDLDPTTTPSSRAMATASVGATTSRPIEPRSDPSPDFSPEAPSSSSSSSRAAEAAATQVPCGGGPDEDVLDLDSPWAAAAEAESRLEEAAMAAAASGLRLHAEGDVDEDEIRNNEERQDDEVYILIKLENSCNPVS